jgi:hypothetical protein
MYFIGHYINTLSDYYLSVVHTLDGVIMLERVGRVLIVNLIGLVREEVYVLL